MCKEGKMSIELSEPSSPELEEAISMEEAPTSAINKTISAITIISVKEEAADHTATDSASPSLGVKKQKINLDQYESNPLIGLEYTVELHSNSFKDIEDCHYICSLCNTTLMDKNQVLEHWISYNHRLNYIKEHYSRANNEYQKLNHKLSADSKIEIVNELARAIEEFHGRTALTVTTVGDYRSNEKKVKNNILLKYHPNEYSGPDFVDIIRNNNWLDGCEIRKTLKKSKKRKKTNQMNLNKPKNTNNNSKDKEDGLAEKANINQLTPQELSIQASQLVQNQYKWEKYYSLLESHLKALQIEYDIFQTEPERHPLYFDEWREFWNRRYRELQQEKKCNPMEYDYKPEWMIYWSERLRELFYIELNTIKRDIKFNLGLPEDTEKDIGKYHLNEYYRGKESSATALKNFKSKQNSKEGKDDLRKLVENEPVIAISRLKSPNTEYYGNKNSNLLSTATTSLPSTSYSRNSIDSNEYVEDIHEAPTRSKNKIDSYKRKYNDYSINEESNISRYTYEPISDSYHHPAPEMPWEKADLNRKHSKKHKYQEHTEGDRDSEEMPLTIVSVLRLLTALEDILGSLGPKVIELLSEALTLEKTETNSSNELLNKKDNSILLETIKEKLKGILIAKVIVDEQKIRAIKKAVKYLATSLHEAKIRHGKSFTFSL